jgi:hypothetical protein
MPLSEQQIETSADISKVHEMVLEALTRKGYTVQQDSTTKIIADQPFSSAYYAHSLEVDLCHGQIGNVIITLRIDNVMSALYVDRLVGELKNILPISQTQAVSTTVLSQEHSEKEISAHAEVNEPIQELVAQPEDSLECANKGYVDTSYSNKKQKKPIAYIIFSFVFAVVGIIVVFSLISSIPNVIGPQQVKVEVSYSGKWQGAVGDLDGIVSWSGDDPRTLTLARARPVGIWIVSANAQKMDASSSILTISIVRMDGTVIKTASTNTAYGMAQIAANIDG